MHWLFFMPRKEKTMEKRELQLAFEKAKEENKPFVFVSIEAENVVEVICIPDVSFEEKLKFYERSYTDELRHVMNKNVFIKSVDYGDSETLNSFF